MIAGSRGGWQTVIADLALILFMVTAAAMGRQDLTSPANPLPARGEPQAIYRLGGGSPSFAEWLAGQARDHRQRLTIVARQHASEIEQATHRALALEAQAARLGYGNTRIILEPSESSEILAVLAFDAGADWHAGCKRGAKQPEDISCD